VHVAVIGAGVSGLAAATEVARLRPDAEVTVFEQAAAPGGKLRSAVLAGHQVDVGAEAMLARRPEGLELIEAAGLGADRIDPLTTSAGVWSPNGLHPIPGGTVMGVPGDVEAARRSGVFSRVTLDRMVAEARTPHDPVTADIAVGRLVAQRLGAEVVDRLVDPLLGGVYAGRADRLSLQATVPNLARELAGGGSLVAAAARAAAGSARSMSAHTMSAHTMSSAAPAPVFTSVRGGLGRIPGALVEQAAFTVRTSTAVRAIRRSAVGFVLSIGPRPEALEVEVDAVVVAAPATKAAALLGDLAPAAAGELATIDTASVAIVSIAVPTAGVNLPPGSGLLVPAGSPSLVKGVTISSQKWPGAPAGLAFIRASIGRFGDEVVLQRGDDELAARAVADLTLLLGAELHPIDALVTRWGGALPQYDVGHVERVQRIRSAVAAVPGLAVAGASYDGVGIPACVASGRAAAHQALAGLPGLSGPVAPPAAEVGGGGQ
jgi:protoporphyrinogen/coproporphyrinogen III oxidase